jgi:hypothetical protein
MEKFVLREHPKLNITMLNDRFSIKQPENQTSEYIFKEVDSFKIGIRVNWFVSAVSFIVGFFIGGSGDVYKEKDLLQFNYKNQPVSIFVKQGDRETIEKAVNRINEKLRQSLNLF